MRVGGVGLASVFGKSYLGLSQVGLSVFLQIPQLWRPTIPGITFRTAIKFVGT